MNQLTGTHGRHWHALRTWPPQIRTAVVVAVCLMVEVVVAKNVMDVQANVLVLLAPLWTFAVSQAWPTQDKASEIARMILAIGATTGVLVFYAL